MIESWRISFFGDLSQVSLSHLNYYIYLSEVCVTFRPLVNPVSFVPRGYVHISQNAPVEIWIETVSYQCFIFLYSPDSYLKVMDKWKIILVQSFVGEKSNLIWIALHFDRWISTDVHIFISCYFEKFPGDKKSLDR